MAVDLVTVTGNIETLTGATPLLSRMWFKLNRPDWNLEGDIFAPEYTEAIADAGGAFSVALQSTDDLEAGASYTAILRYREPLDGKDREYPLSNFLLPTGGPYQLGDLLTVPFIEPVPADILALATAAAVAADASADAAALSADDAANSATEAALYDGKRFDTVALMLADTALTYTPALPGTVVAGDYINTRKELYAYRVAASAATDHQLVTAGGVKLYVVAVGNMFFVDTQFGTGKLQEATDYVLANGGGTLYVAEDHTLTATWVQDNPDFNTAIRVLGKGRNRRITQTATGVDLVKISETIIMQDGAMNDLHLICDADAGNIITFGDGVTKFDFRRLQCTQNNPNKHILYADFGGAGGIYDSIFGDFDWTLTPGHNVAGVYIRASATVFNENRFTGGRYYNATDQPFFDIQTDAGTTNWFINNTFENMNFEICPGGGFKLGAFKGCTLRNISFWDAQGPYTGNLVHFVPVSGGYESIANTLQNIQRHGDTLTAGVREIDLQDAQDTLVLNCYTPAGDGPSYDFRNKRVTQAGLMFGVINTTFTNVIGGLSQTLYNADLTANRLATPAQTGLVIAAGVITVTGSAHTVDTEAAAATDDLITINGGVDGQFLTIRPANDARTIVVTASATITLNGGGTFSMDTVLDSITFRYDAPLARWFEIGRCNT